MNKGKKKVNYKIKDIFYATPWLLALISNHVTAQTRRGQPQLDPVPQAPTTTMNDPGITQQAGAGGREGYAHAGVLELGGSAGLTAAKDFSQFSIAPSVGWFVADNVQLTGIVSLSRAKVGSADAAFTFSVLAEPSYHYEFTNSQFGFVGLGLGLAGNTGVDVGFAMAPRIGYKTLVGRSGVVTLDLRNTIATNDFVQTPQGEGLTVSSALSVGAGYTILW
jgi:hypothetical protein